jgi:hypothetical protein
VGPAEGDDLLCSLGHGKLATPEARWFWMELVGSKESAMSMQDMEGYEELMQKLLDTLPPEQVLSHYTAEQRLVDLDRDHQALAVLQAGIVALLEARCVVCSDAGRARVSSCADVPTLQRWLAQAMRVNTEAELFSG